MKRISVSKCKVRDEIQWRVRWHEGGAVKRRFVATRAEAEAFAADRRGEAQGTALAKFSALSVRDRDAVMTAWDEARRLGVNLLELVMRPSAPAAASVTIREAIEAMLASKRAAGRSERYCAGLKWTVNDFARGKEEVQITQLHLKEIETWLATKRPANFATCATRVSTLLNFAIRRGWYHAANPCARLERMKLPYQPPAVLTVAQAAAALDHLQTHPRLLAWFALSALAGLRPEEAQQTNWSAIDFDAGLIRVEAQTSKMGQRRIVYPQPMVFVWLRRAEALNSSLPLTAGVRIRELKDLRRALGLKKWPQDCTRHSAASYWLAACGSAATVATALGHSEATLRKHYMALVPKSEAEKYWALSPTCTAAAASTPASAPAGRPPPPRDSSVAPHPAAPGTALPGPAAP